MSDITQMDTNSEEYQKYVEFECAGLEQEYATYGFGKRFAFHNNFNKHIKRMNPVKRFFVSFASAIRR